MNYYVNNVSFRHVQSSPIHATDFSDHATCFRLVEEMLNVRPKSYIALGIILEDEVLDRQLILQYRFSGTPGKLAVTLIDEDTGVINQDIHLFVNETGKVVGNPEDLDDETVEEIVKIILDYGEYIVLGVQWSAFLMKEHQDGALEQFFDDLTQEIH